MLTSRNQQLFTDVKQVFVLWLGTSSIFEPIYSSSSKTKARVISKKTNAGVEYQNEIKTYLPGISESTFLQLQRAVNSQVIVRVIFCDNKTYLIGSEEIPLTVNMSFQNKKGATVTFKNKTFQPNEFLGFYSSRVFSPDVFTNDVYTSE